MMKNSNHHNHKNNKKKMQMMIMISSVVLVMNGFLSSALYATAEQEVPNNNVAIDQIDPSSSLSPSAPSASFLRKQFNRFSQFISSKFSSPEMAENAHVAPPIASTTSNEKNNNNKFRKSLPVLQSADLLDQPVHEAGRIPLTLLTKLASLPQTDRSAFEDDDFVKFILQTDQFSGSTECECYDHASGCNAGICVGCSGGTRGDHCELCKPGYYGDATQGDCAVCGINFWCAGGTAPRVPCPGATGTNGVKTASSVRQCNAAGGRGRGRGRG
jgi:hypothetical protein